MTAVSTLLYKLCTNAGRDEIYQIELHKQRDICKQSVYFTSLLKKKKKTNEKKKENYICLIKSTSVFKIPKKSVLVGGLICINVEG